MSSRPSPTLLTAEEAAERMRVPIGTLRHWVLTDKAPPSARIGRRRYWLASDCDEWIEAQFDRTAE